MREYILSVDASLSSTGWSVMEKKTKEVIDLGRTCTTNKIPEDDRIMTIVDVLVEKVQLYSIKEVVIEDQFVGNNMKTGMQLSRLRGGIMVAMRMLKAKVDYIPPSVIRQILMSKGNATKEEVAQAVLDLYPNNIFVQNLGPFSDKSNKKKNSDMYDAVSIGVAYITKEEAIGAQLTA